MRFAALVACLSAVAALIGCTDEKQLPTRDAVVAPEPKNAEPKIPAESEPAAKAVVERCLKAMTGGDPAKLAKARTTRAAYSGAVRIAEPTSGFIRVETKFRMEAVWPDRARGEFDFQSSTIAPLHTGFRRPAVWMFRHENRSRWVEVNVGSQTEKERLVAIDMVGTYWMPQCVPLLDPKAIAFDARTVTTPPQPADIISVAVPNCPVFTLWFDPATSFLRRIDYTKTLDGGQPVIEAMILEGHRSFDGLMLPGKILHQTGGQNVEEWTVDSIEFPASIDEARFDPPKADGK